MVEAPMLTMTGSERGVRYASRRLPSALGRFRNAGQIDQIGAGGASQNAEIECQLQALKSRHADGEDQQQNGTQPSGHAQLDAKQKEQTQNGFQYVHQPGENWNQGRGSPRRELGNMAVKVVHAASGDPQVPDLAPQTKTICYGG